MPDVELCLSVDLGTGGPKVGIITLDGELIAFEHHSVDTHFDHDGAATQDAEEWWTLIRSASARLLARPDVSPDLVRAIVVTGQYASTVPVDEQGLATGPCVTWLDTRGGPYARRAVGGALQGFNAKKLRLFIRKTGGAPSTAGADPVGQILYLMNEEPELVAKTRWFMEPVDYLTMKFSGVASGTHASRLAMWMTDNRHLTKLDYDDALLAAVGLHADRLPPLLHAGSVLGPVKGEVARELGLPLDTVVLAGLPDLHAAAYGAGATALYATHVALSTTSWISCPVPSKGTDIFHSIAAVPGLTNDSYVVINNQETGGKSLEWLRGVLAGSGDGMSFDEMTALAASSPPGSNGVLFTPWLAGERSPVDDKRARAGFVNLSITTTTADLIRAVMEGVAANSAWLFGYVEKFTGERLTPLRLIGGGAQSELWCQIFADTLDREVHQVRDPMTAQLRGMALMASVALGRRHFEDLVSVTVPVKAFHPNPDDASHYRANKANLPLLYERDKRWAKRTRAK